MKNWRTIFISTFEIEDSIVSNVNTNASLW